MKSFLFAAGLILCEIVDVASGFSWTNKNYSDICIEDSGSLWAEEPDYWAQDPDTGYVWIVTERDDCSSQSVSYYNPTTDSFVIDNDRTSAVGTWFWDTDNPVNSVILDGIMYLVDGFGGIGFVNITGDNTANDDDLDDISGFGDWCVTGDATRGELYLIDERDFYVFDIETQTAVESHRLSYEHDIGACAIVGDTLYALGGSTKFIEKIDLDDVIMDGPNTTGTGWTTLDVTLDLGYSATDCDFVGTAETEKDEAYSGVEGAAVAVVDDRYIVLLGGECNSLFFRDNTSSAHYIDIINNVIIFDTNDEASIYSSPSYDLPSNRYNGHASVSLDGNTLYYIMGASEDDIQTQTIYSADISDFASILSLGSINAPYPDNSTADDSGAGDSNITITTTSVDSVDGSSSTTIATSSVDGDSGESNSTVTTSVGSVDSVDSSSDGMRMSNNMLLDLYIGIEGVLFVYTCMWLHA